MTDAVNWKRIDFSYSIVEEHFEHVWFWKYTLIIISTWMYTCFCHFLIHLSISFSKTQTFNAPEFNNFFAKLNNNREKTEKMPESYIAHLHLLIFA